MTKTTTRHAEGRRHLKRARRGRTRPRAQLAAPRAGVCTGPAGPAPCAAGSPVTNCYDCVILGGMEHSAPPRRGMSNGQSFSNGNGSPDDDRLQMEGWVLRPVHWWLWA